MKALKCSACGAILKNEADECVYCGMRFSVPPKAEKQPEIEAKPQMEDAQIPRYVPNRPAINFVAAVLLFCFGFPFGLLYCFSVFTKQREWDAKYRRH